MYFSIILWLFYAVLRHIDSSKYDFKFKSQALNESEKWVNFYTSWTQNLFSSLISMEWWYLVTQTIWATSWENLFLPYANNKDADQPAHLRICAVWSASLLFAA